MTKYHSELCTEVEIGLAHQKPVQEQQEENLDPFCNFSQKHIPHKMIFYNGHIASAIIDWFSLGESFGTGIPHGTGLSVFSLLLDLPAP